MSKQRRGGLGRGLGALIPTAPPAIDRTPEAELSDSTAPATAAEPDGTATRSEPDSTATRAEPDGTATRAEPDETTPTGRPDSVDLAAVPGAAYADLPVAEIRPNPKQPRQVFDDDALAELAHSIREFGVLQPIVVRPIDSVGAPDGNAGGDARWELVMGERRLRAATAAGLSTVPAIVRTTTDDAMLRDALLENVHRAQLNPLEEAAAYQQLLDEFGATHDELAQRLGRSRPQVSNTVRLLQLSLPVQRRVAAGVLSAGHARALLALDDATDQDELAARIVAEGLSVRATEELVALARRGTDQRVARRRHTAPRITAPAVAELADNLSDVFDTRVRVDLGRRKGKITVEFASIDDLERIVSVMAPQLASRRAANAQSADPGPEPNTP